jgi:dihydroorotate dehydrogenase (NAD+) catalytic subunit
MTVLLPEAFPCQYFIASGGLGFDGRGYFWERAMSAVGIMRFPYDRCAVILKTLTLKPTKGNLNMLWPMGCVRRLSVAGDDVTFLPWEWRADDGFLNAVGLTNPGLEGWIAEYAPSLARTSIHAIMSIKPDTPAECSLMVQRITDLEHKNIHGIEVNVSCPNTGEEVSQKIKHVIRILSEALESTGLPIMVKFGHDDDAIAVLKEFRGTRLIVDLINTVGYTTVYPGTRSPLAHLNRVNGGGVSGPVIIPFRDAAYQRIRDALPDFPIILGGGIHSQSELRRTWEMKPDAVSIGTIILKQPNFLDAHV